MSIPYYSRDLKHLKVNPWRRRIVIAGLVGLYVCLISEWAW